MVELPPPPDQKRGLTRQERKAIDSADKTLRDLLPALKRLNELTDVIDQEVDIHQVDRITRDKIAMLMWQGEFMQKILEHSNPNYAGMEILKYVAGLHAQHDHAQIQVREVSVEEAQRLGYL